MNPDFEFPDAMVEVLDASYSRSFFPNLIGEVLPAMRHGGSENIVRVPAHNGFRTLVNINRAGENEFRLVPPLEALSMAAQ